METRMDYELISLPKPGTRIFKTKAYSSEVTAVGGVRITRIVNAPLDYFLIEGPEVIEGIVEIPYQAVLKAVRKPGPVLVAKGGKAKDAA